MRKTQLPLILSKSSLLPSNPQANLMTPARGPFILSRRRQWRKHAVGTAAAAAAGVRREKAAAGAVGVSSSTRAEGACFARPPGARGMGSRGRRGRLVQPPPRRRLSGTRRGRGGPATAVEVR